MSDLFNMNNSTSVSSTWKNKKRAREDNDIFHATQPFSGYDMNFLKTPIQYNFEGPVELRKTKFNYAVKKTCSKDMESINKIIGKLNPNLKINPGDYFMNGKDVKFFNDDFPGDSMQFEENKTWMLKISIQGYKSASNSRMSPIWRIDEAQLAFIQ